MIRTDHDGGRVRVAPATGEAIALESLPDPVFAGKMLGDGVAVKPTDDLVVSPADGEVILVAKTAHAVAIKTREGEEFLLHLGIETVGLGGEGMHALVTLGEQVTAGQPLVRVQWDAIRDRIEDDAVILLLTNKSGPHITWRATGSVTAGASPVLTVEG